MLQMTIDTSRAQRGSPTAGSPALELDLSSHAIPSDALHQADASRPNSRWSNVYVMRDMGFCIAEHMSVECRKLVLDQLMSNPSNDGADNSDDLSARLARALAAANAGPSASVLVAIFRPDGVLRVAWAGTAGLVIIRGGEFVFRTYARKEVRDSLEEMFRQDKHVLGGVRFPFCSQVPVQEGAGSTTSEQLVSICSTELHLEDGDLLLSGSQALFSNLSEHQMKSFVRPVEDKNDPTLAIANATCLGSWTTDDPDFVSYYLAHLADNYANSAKAEPLLSYPFPPSPNLDDIVVVAGACSYM